MVGSTIILFYPRFYQIFRESKADNSKSIGIVKSIFLFDILFYNNFHNFRGTGHKLIKDSKRFFAVWHGCRIRCARARSTIDPVSTERSSHNSHGERSFRNCENCYKIKYQIKKKNWFTIRKLLELSSYEFRQIWYYKMVVNLTTR